MNTPELGTRHTRASYFSLLPLGAHDGLSGRHTAVGMILLKMAIRFHHSLTFNIQLPPIISGIKSKVLATVQGPHTMDSRCTRDLPSFCVHQHSHTGLPDALQMFQASSFLGHLQNALCDNPTLIRTLLSLSLPSPCFTSPSGTQDYKTTHMYSDSHVWSNHKGRGLICFVHRYISSA